MLPMTLPAGEFSATVKRSGPTAPLMVPVTVYCPSDP
jgi:hypothetical protein